MLKKKILMKNKKRILLLSITILVIFIYLYPKIFIKNKKIKRREGFTIDIPFKKEGELTIRDTIKFDIEIAEGIEETAQGLMYRNGIKENRGMLFIFPNEDYRGFYMKNTRFSLDIIFINSKKEIIHIHKNAKPYNLSSIPSKGLAKYVFEIKAGMSNKLGIKKGDKIKYKKNL